MLAASQDSSNRAGLIDSLPQKGFGRRVLLRLLVPTRTSRAVQVLDGRLVDCRTEVDEAHVQLRIIFLEGPISICQ